MPPGQPGAAIMRALYSLRRGGRAANVGAVMDVLPLNAFCRINTVIDGMDQRNGGFTNFIIDPTRAG